MSLFYTPGLLWYLFVFMVRILTSMFIFSNLFLRSQNCTNSNTMGATLTQQLLPLPEHMSSPPVCSGVRVDWSLDFCVVFCRSLLVFLFFSLLVIVLSVLLWFTASDYLPLVSSNVSFFSSFMFTTWTMTCAPSHWCYTPNSGIYRQLSVDIFFVISAKLVT